MLIAIIGAGNFGTAVAWAAAAGGHKIVLYDIIKSRVDDINQNHRNSEVFPDLTLPTNITASSQFDSYLSECDLVGCVVSTTALPAVLGQIKQFLRPNTVILNLSKGFDQATGNTLDEVYYEVIGREILFGVATGPTFAIEIVRGDPSRMVLATGHDQVFEVARAALAGSQIFLERGTDIKGVEVCSAVKNIMAIVTGLHSGLGFGYNSKFSLLTMAIREVQALMVAAGGQVETMWSVAGVGDLMMTATSEHSRNYRFGMYLGQGLAVAEALQKVGSTVEGLDAIKPALMLAGRYNLKLPIVQALEAIVFAQADPKERLLQLICAN